MALYTFGDILLDTAEKRVWRDNQPVALAGMPLAALCYFIEHAADGRTVTRDELRKQLWRIKVEDVTIRSCLKTLRKALRDPVAAPRYVKTHGKDGWRLLPQVHRLCSQPRSALPPAPGGSYELAHYIPRSSEEQQLRSCLQGPGQFAVVFGPPGCGKRLLIERVLQQALQSDSALLSRALRVSIRAAVEQHGATLDGLLKEIGRLILRASGKPEEATDRRLNELWSPNILAKQKLRELMMHLLIADPPPKPGALPTALILYEADRLTGCSFHADVFNMLRAWQSDHFLDSLRLVIATSVPPRLFPLGVQSSLWTKVQRMDVSRIKLEPLMQLAELHGVHFSRPACERLGELVGWNVYLCRTALYYAAVHGLSVDAVLAAHQPSQRAFGAFTEHLEDLSQDLGRLDAIHTFPKPLGLLSKDAVDGATLPLEAAWLLFRKGVIAEAETRCHFRCRCPLYADFFRHLRS